MLSSLSTSTMRQYDNSFRLWWDFCSAKNIAFCNPTTAEVITFLQSLASKTNHKFGTFNSHASAIALLCSSNFSADPLFKRFKRGLSRLRPSRPKYSTTWDPKQLLNFIQTLPAPLTLKLLSQKLVTLLALITGHRLQTISLIRLSNILDSSSEIRINISDTIKTIGLGRVQPTLCIPIFLDKPFLCVATCLREYIARSKPLRKPGCDFLFISIRKPHGPASKDTISRWIYQMLDNAGINTNLFKPHSTRHASTSAALREGVSVDVICRTAGWSQQSATFARFYNRPLSASYNFAERILNLS